VWFDYWQEKETFFISKAPRQTLDSTQSPIQWVPRALSLGVNGSSSVTLTNHSHLVLMLKMSGAIMSTSPHACMADTGTVLTFTWFCQVR